MKLFVQITLANHPCIPYLISWNTSIAAAGTDGSLFFYTDEGCDNNYYD